MSMRSTPEGDPRSGWVVDQQPGDSVVIAGGIEIVLLRVHGDRAEIGVIAPEGVAITPGEVQHNW
jgi:sRNA-binding carbon storage regulator CsrA